MCYVITFHYEPRLRIRPPFTFATLTLLSVGSQFPPEFPCPSVDVPAAGRTSVDRVDLLRPRLNENCIPPQPLRSACSFCSPRQLWRQTIDPPEPRNEAGHASAVWRHASWHRNLAGWTGRHARKAIEQQPVPAIAGSRYQRGSPGYRALGYRARERRKDSYAVTGTQECPARAQGLPSSMSFISSRQTPHCGAHSKAA